MIKQVEEVLTSEQFASIGKGVRNSADGNHYVAAFAASLIGKSYPIGKKSWDILFKTYDDEALGRKFTDWIGSHDKRLREGGAPAKEMAIEADAPPQSEPSKDEMFRRRVLEHLGRIHQMVEETRQRTAHIERIVLNMEDWLSALSHGLSDGLEVSVLSTKLKEPPHEGDHDRERPAAGPVVGDQSAVQGRGDGETDVRPA